MKKQLLTLLALLIAISSFSNPINEATAKRYAENFWKENRIMGVRNGKVFKKKAEEARFVNIATRGGYSEFYIFNNEIGKGFVIVSADNCVTPILGYSYDNNFVVENMPDNVKGWMDHYAEQISLAVSERVVATDEIRNDWEYLRQGKHLPIKSETSVAPLIITKWNQSPYYNALCPYDEYYYELTVTGCAATAMAQVMKYYAYPEHGSGIESYKPTNYEHQYVDFGNTYYQWNSMPVPSATGPNNAVATLMYHCGVSIHMDYGLAPPHGTGSSAWVISCDGQYPYCVENALKEHFDYKSTLHGEIRQFYSDIEWKSLLKADLNQLRPIIYSGFDIQYGGHAFICDGYDNYDLFSFNWGWGSSCDGYFFINLLNPDIYHYDYGQHALLGIEPNNTSNNFYLNLGDDLSCEPQIDFYDDIEVFAQIDNDGSGIFTGYIGAGVFMEIEPSSYEYIGIMAADNQTIPAGFYAADYFECQGGPPMIPGSYVVSILYSLDGEIWNYVDNNGYYDAFFDITYSSYMETNSDFTILTGDCLYNGVDATINVDIWNTGNTTFYGKFRLNLAELDGSWVQNIDIFECNDGLQPNYHYTCGIDYTGTITAEPGIYSLELAYQESGSSSWYYAGASNYQNPIWVYVMPAPYDADPYEPNNSEGQTYTLPITFTGNSAVINTNDSNFHNSSDVDYYKINLASGYDYDITARLHDSFNSGNGNSYTVDAMFSYSIDGQNWSESIDDVMQGDISVVDGGTLYFVVTPWFGGSIGTYLLSLNLTRTQHAPSTYQISATASPSSGGTVTGAGTYAQGETCTLTATANTNYSFVNWTENGAQVSANPNYSFTVTENRTLVANFTYSPVMYTINATANPSVGGTINGTGQYASGETCTLTAMPNSDYIFTNWTENGTQVSANASYSFTVTSNRNLVANFTYSPNVFTITAVANPTNGGNVSGAGNYEAGQTCSLNASSNTGFTFVNWTENGSQVSTNASYSFTVTGNRNLVANFTQNSYIITVSTNPSNGGTATGSGTYNYGQNCTVSASPNNGFAFTNWTENGTQVSTNATYSFTVNGNRNLVANFAQNVHTITATAGANGSISPSGAVSVANGGSQTFEMIPNSGYAVFEVYVDGNLVGSMTSFTFNNVEADHSIFVTFQHIDGIGENMNNEIVIYPNPTNGILNVQCSKIDEIRVYNAYGVLIDKAKTNGKELIQIDLSNASAGVYLMQAIRNDESISKVFVKE